MNRTRPRTLVLAFALTLFGSARLTAQLSSGALSSDILRPSSASYYFISKPGELSMQVNIWGFVQNPGRYEVPTATDLVKLLSYAGGPKQDAILDEVRVTRSITKSRGGSVEEFYVDLDNLSEVEPASIVLYPDDTIFIDHSNWVNIRDLFTILTTAAIITTATAAVINATNNPR